MSTPDVFLTQIDADVDYLLLASDGLLQKLTLPEIDAYLKVPCVAARVRGACAARSPTGVPRRRRSR